MLLQAGQGPGWPNVPTSATSALSTCPAGDVGCFLPLASHCCLQVLLWLREAQRWCFRFLTSLFYLCVIHPAFFTGGMTCSKRNFCLTCSHRDILLRTHTQTLTSTSLVKFLHLFFWPENTYQKLLMVDIFRGFTRSSAVKNPPAMQETRVWTLGWEDPLQKEMTTYSNTFVWEIPWTEEPGGLQSMGSQRVRHDLLTKQDQHISRDISVSVKHTFSAMAP